MALIPFRIRTILATAGVSLLTLASAVPAAAQAARVGGSMEIIPSQVSARFPAVAYHPVSDSYLVVTGISKVSARFVSASGQALGAADSVNNGGPGAAGVACSPTVDVCLITWIQEPANIMGRLVRNNNGNLQVVSGAFAVSANGVHKLTSTAPGVAAAASGEFLVAWTEVSPYAAVQAQRVTADGQITGSQITIYPPTPGVVAMLPTLAYNPNADEYGVGFQYEAGINQVVLQRVKPGTGALIGGPSVIYSGIFAQYPEIAFSSVDNRYMAITWGGALITGGLADATGQPLTGAVPIAIGGLGDGIGLAYNPISNTYLAVFLSVNNPEIWAAEIDKNGVPGNQFQLTAWGAVDNVNFSTQPGAAGSTREQLWLEINSAGYQRIVGNMAGQAGPPPPPPDSRIMSLGGTLAFGRIPLGTTSTKTMTISNTGNKDLTITGINYPRGFDGNWQSGTIAAGATKNVSVTFTPTLASAYSGTIIISGNQTSGASTVTVSGSGSLGTPGDFDGTGDADVAVFRPSNGTWYVRNKATVQFGEPGDIPVAGDYNGDRTVDYAVYRPSTGFWYVKDKAPVRFGEPGDVPVPADYNGDGITDIAVYRRSSGQWFVRNQFSVQYGGPGYLPLVADFNGDGKSDVAVYQPETGLWFARDQFAIGYGSPGDIPVPGDYDGDGKSDIAVYRPSTGAWFVRGQFVVSYGSVGDLPIPRDFNGDGRTDIAVYRPSDGTWFAKDLFTVQFGEAADLPVPRNAAGAGLDGDFNGDGLTDVIVYRPSSGQWLQHSGALKFGDAGDRPIPADYNGDRVMDAAVFRPSNGNWFVRGQFSLQFGDPGDQPVPGDYDGSGLMDVAVYKPSNGFWYVRNQFTVQFGDHGDVPVPGDYNGDGKTDVAVYRPSNGMWYVRNQFGVSYGDPGDIPVPGDYDGDGKTDVAVYRPSTGMWYVRNKPGVQFGDQGDLPVPGDFNGDGKLDIAVYRPSTGTWFVRGQFTVQFGDAGDIPVVRVGGGGQ